MQSCHRHPRLGLPLLSVALRLYFFITLWLSVIPPDPNELAYPFIPIKIPMTAVLCQLTVSNLLFNLSPPIGLLGLECTTSSSARINPPID